MNATSRHQWPMDTYLAAWKTFRRLSNENKVTAEHIVKRPHWPDHSEQVLIDVGCGDGKLLEEILLVDQCVREVRLIDPDCELLSEAEKCLKKRVPNTRPHLKGIEAILPVDVEGASCLTVVHVVYLVEKEVVRSLFEVQPLEVPMYLVLDHPESIFTSLWERTAPHYHQCAAEAHELIKGLPDSFEVNETEIQSTIRNPLSVKPADVRDVILSFLTYSDVGPSTDPNRKKWIEHSIDKRLNGDKLHCVSSCYEIIRHY